MLAGPVGARGIYRERSLYIPLGWRLRSSHKRAAKPSKQSLNTFNVYHNSTMPRSRELRKGLWFRKR